MTRPQENSEHLWMLIRADVDGSLTDGETTELEQLLSGDDRSARAYLDYLHLHADLTLWCRESHSFASSLARVSEAIAAEESRQLSVVRKKKSDQRSASRSQPVGHALRDDSSQIDSARGACPTPHSKSWLDRASRRPVRPALAIAALVMISVVAWMGVTTVKTRIAQSGRKGTDEAGETTKPEFVAWLMKAHKTQWLDNTEPQRTRLMPGQRLAIAKGLIEIQYRTRAVVVIEGPAEFMIGSQKTGVRNQESEDRSLGREPVVGDKEHNCGYLAHGSLVARVEGEKAKGFTVDTPYASIEDFGTEFGVDVEKNGAAEFVVLSGEVDVIREASGGRPAQRLRLTKDQGAFVAAKAAKITRRAKVDAQLIAAYRKRLEEALPTQAPDIATITQSPSDGFPAIVTIIPGTGQVVASPPAVSPPDIANFGGQIGSVQGLGRGGYGQTFTTGRNEGGYLLRSFTVGQSGFGLTGHSLGTLEVGTLSDGEFIAIKSEVFAGMPGFYANSFYTYTFANPVKLSANTRCAVQIVGMRLPDVLLNTELAAETSYTTTDGVTVVLDRASKDLSFAVDLEAIAALAPVEETRDIPSRDKKVESLGAEP